MSVLLLSASDTSIGNAALYSFIGFIIVLVVLALLVGIFYLSGILFRTKYLSREKLFERTKKETEHEPAYVPEVEVTDDRDVIAAITAAISVILQEESGDEKPDFVIRRISRKK